MWLLLMCSPSTQEALSGPGSLEMPPAGKKIPTDNLPFLLRLISHQRNFPLGCLLNLESPHTCFGFSTDGFLCVQRSSCREPYGSLPLLTHRSKDSPSTQPRSLPQQSVGKQCSGHLWLSLVSCPNLAVCRECIRGSVFLVSPILSHHQNVSFIPAGTLFFRLCVSRA